MLKTLAYHCIEHNLQLLAEWDKERNKELSPHTVSIGSGKKAWWKCERGHSWAAIVASRVKGVGCPVCAGKKVMVGYNDLATVRPDLAHQWHPAKNGSLTPGHVTKGSGKRRGGCVFGATSGKRKLQAVRQAMDVQSVHTHRFQSKQFIFMLNKYMVTP